MKITKKTSRKEFAAIVVHQLEKHGIVSKNRVSTLSIVIRNCMWSFPVGR